MVVSITPDNKFVIILYQNELPRKCILEIKNDKLMQCRKIKYIFNFEDSEVEIFI